jgi:hypothetical protein
MLPKSKQRGPDGQKRGTEDETEHAILAALGLLLARRGGLIASFLPNSCLGQEALP